jgi:DNA-binding winged helix-turn-helix (wHTH) protein
LLFSFENFLLDSDRRELRRGAVLVPVEPKVFDFLTYLIQNRDRVVSKDELIATVWQRRVISDSALVGCFSKIEGSKGGRKCKPQSSDPGTHPFTLAEATY